MCSIVFCLQTQSFLSFSLFKGIQSSTAHNDLISYVPCGKDRANSEMGLETNTATGSDKE